MSDPINSENVTLTADDYVAANKLFMIKFLTSRRHIIIWVVILAFAIAAITSLHYFYPRRSVTSLICPGSTPLRQNWLNC